MQQKPMVGARAKWVLSGVEQCETCAEGGPTHQLAKDSAALLRVRAVQVCTHNYVKSRILGDSYRPGRASTVGPDQSLGACGITPHGSSRLLTTAWGCSQNQIGNAGK